MSADEPTGNPVIDIATLDTHGGSHWLRLRHTHSPLMKRIREKHRLAASQREEALRKMNRIHRMLDKANKVDEP